MGNPIGSTAAQSAPTASMLALIGGFRIAHVLYVAASLGLADLLRDGPRSSDELAEATDTHEPSLARILRALLALGVLTRDPEGRFGLTALGATLRSDGPGSLRAWILFALSEENLRTWGELLHSVRTGETAFDHVYKMGVWPYRQQNPEHGRLFDAGMAALMNGVDAAFAAAYPFADVRRVVDVGGGDGTLLITLLRAHPELEGVLFDLPEVATGARQRIAEAGLAHRCSVVAGDVFEAVPGDGDCYLLSRVIHDWDDERALAILRNCCRAMPEQGKLLLLERIFPTEIEPSPALLAAALTDMNMMLVTGGRERTEAEYRKLLSLAGVDAVKMIPTGSGLSVLEGRRAAGPR
jgi:ubiquinone/menaquinone biosynthesis C-methylase UbiE